MNPGNRKGQNYDSACPQPITDKITSIFEIILFSLRWPEVRRAFIATGGPLWLCCSHIVLTDSSLQVNCGCCVSPTKYLSEITDDIFSTVNRPGDMVGDSVCSGDLILSPFGSPNRNFLEGEYNERLSYTHR